MLPIDPDAEILKRKRQRLFESNTSRRTNFFRDNIFESESFQIHSTLTLSPMINPGSFYLVIYLVV